LSPCVGNLGGTNSDCLIFGKHIPTLSILAKGVISVAANMVHDAPHFVADLVQIIGATC
jgi:hypothetical protein